MFEKQPELGGVWAAAQTYPGLRANNSRETYAFSDYPYPETADDFPTAEQVQKNGQFRLYRHILPPQQPALGFIGYASSTACQLTSEIAAHWLSQCFRGELALGSVAEMEHEISQVLQWAAEVFPARSQGYFIGPYLAHYLDDLLRDMDLLGQRTSNFFTEHFAPLWPDRYWDLGEQRRRARVAGQSIAHNQRIEDA